MDKNELSKPIIQEMAELFAATIGEMLPQLLHSDLDGIERSPQQVGRSILGKVVERVVAVAAAQGCQGQMRRVDGRRRRLLQGLVGDYQIERAYFVCDGCGLGCCLLEERLGIGPGSLSPGLSRVACRLRTFSRRPSRSSSRRRP